MRILNFLCVDLVLLEEGVKANFGLVESFVNEGDRRDFEKVGFQAIHLVDFVG